MIRTSDEGRIWRSTRTCQPYTLICEDCGKPFQAYYSNHGPLCRKCYLHDYYAKGKRHLRKLNGASAARHHAAHREERLAYMRAWRQRRKAERG